MLSSHWRKCAIALSASGSFMSYNTSICGAYQSDSPWRALKSDEKFKTIVVGGGSSGCIIAYLTARWMEEKNIPGKVLLVDRGPDFTAEKGPSPHMISWYDNWANFGVAHDTAWQNGDSHHIPATEHRGIGGCGSHDTRITFQPTLAQKKRFSNMMGWSLEQTQSYYRAALNMIPVSRAIHEKRPERWYEEVITALTDPEAGPGALQAAPGNTFGTKILRDCIAENSLAMYGDEEIRWTSAYLLRPDVRPANLEVVSESIVDRVTYRRDNNSSDSSSGESSAVSARGVLVRDLVTGTSHELLLEDKGDVVLASGSFGCPAILQRSGIGPRKLLTDLGIPVIVDNPEVGHGVDHPEIALLYRWNTSSFGDVPKGGAMGWPLVLFADIKETYGNTFTQCHFGAGNAEPYTSDPAIVVTPNCTRPDALDGFWATIKSKDALVSVGKGHPPAETVMSVVHADGDKDTEMLAVAVKRIDSLMQLLQAKGLAGERLEPPIPADPKLDIFKNDPLLRRWIKHGTWTVYHWCCTCKAGRGEFGHVADEQFRVLLNRPITGENKERGVVEHLYVSSASCLPEIPEANPHLTVTAFSIALAEGLVNKYQTQILGADNVTAPAMMVEARISATSETTTAGATGDLVCRRPGEEVPSLHKTATKYSASYDECNKD